MARLIDADLINDCLSKVWGSIVKRRKNLGTDEYEGKDYDQGKLDMMSYIGHGIEDGDFDPPKFSYLHTDRVKTELVFLKDYQDTKLNELCDHLITYLDQLRESK